MAETLGSLCDKLTIVELKQWHTSDEDRLASLSSQARQLAIEIDDYLRDALRGSIASDRMTFASNKVFDVGDAEIRAATGSIGELVAALAAKNCELWHEQEKVYEIQKAPESHGDAVGIVARLGRLNLERTECIDAIDRALRDHLSPTEATAS